MPSSTNSTSTAADWESCARAVVRFDEYRIKKLQQRLDALDEHRAKIKAELNEIMRRAITTERIESPPQAHGDAELFYGWTKARLLQTIEEHWSIHHMAAVPFFEDWDRTKLVNYLLDIKGLTGLLEPQPAKKRTTNALRRTRSSVWRD